MYWRDIALTILFIAEVNFKLCLIFQNDRLFEFATILLAEAIPEVEYTSKITMSIFDILSFWSKL